MTSATSISMTTTLLRDSLYPAFALDHVETACAWVGDAALTAYD